MVIIMLASTALIASSILSINKKYDTQLIGTWMFHAALLLQYLFQTHIIKLCQNKEEATQISSTRKKCLVTHNFLN